MTDVNEIEALKAAMRGARSTAAALATLNDRVESLDPHREPSESDLDDLQRLANAHALAAQSLRGLIHTMLIRRGRITREAVGETSGGDE